MKLETILPSVEALGQAKSDRQIAQICRAVSDEQGYDHFIFGSYLPDINDIVLVDGFPSAWRERYDEENYLHDDPVVKHAAVSSTVLDWKNVPLGAAARHERGNTIMAEAADHGLAHGITLPTHGAGAEWGLLSFAGRHDPGVGVDDNGTALQFFAQAVHESVKRVVPRMRTRTRVDKPLTERETECLKWVANGKTAWETARILGLSESTITFHVQNAIQKLGVANRPQAVARALALSRIAIF